ncbi:protein kinase [Pontiellaceae bacterium B1224]|nr:protein kinase [Pontiellaceae bacterium B1224]
MKTHPNKTCPQCGALLLPDAPAGLCPVCVMAMNLATPTMLEEDGAAGHIRFEPPALEEIIPLFQQLEIIELLGRGGMGVVYKARQKKIDRLVALKILPKEIGGTAGFADRFVREARALGQLNHPNIVTLYEFGHVELEGGEPLYYFLMEYVDGLNLRQLQGNGRVEPREALAIVPQICDALQYAHDQGIVHRDIKPENILLDRRGSVKVADFGLAKIAGSVESPPPAGVDEPISNRQSTVGNVILGTPKYMSPEQIEAPGNVDHRADIYALGVVFYQMLTNEMPSKELQPPSKKVRIDVRLDEVVLRALEEKPDRRYQQASTMKTQVETIMEKAEPKGRGFKFAVMGMAAVVAVLLGLGLLFVATDPEQAVAQEEPLNTPHALKEAPTELVIEVGLKNMRTPWAWQELERRFEEGQLSDQQIDRFVDALVRQWESDSPNGYHFPLMSLEVLLTKFSDEERLSDEQKLDLLTALQGAPSVQQLPRVKQGDEQVDVFVQWRTMHEHRLFGLVMLSRIASILIDGKSVELLADYPINPKLMGAEMPIPVSDLKPGAYPLEVRVLTAWVEEEAAAVFSADTKTADWPVVEKQWIRTCSDTLRVFSPDETVLAPVDDPQLDPVTAGALGVESVNINSIKNGAALIASFKFAISKVPVPVSADVFLTLGDQTYPCGTQWAYSKEQQSGYTSQAKKVELPRLDSSIKTAMITLKYNPEYLERNSMADSVWSRDIVLWDVPVVRYDPDLPGSMLVAADPTDLQRPVKGFADDPRQQVAGTSFGGIGQAPEPTSQGGLTITVSAEGVVYIEGQPCPLDRLDGELKRLADSGKDSVLVRAERQTSYRYVSGVMAACKAAGFNNVIFSVKASEAGDSDSLPTDTKESR